MSAGTRNRGGDEMSYAHLLATVRAERPSKEARQRTLAALGLSAAAAASLAPAAAKKTVWSLWMKLLAGTMATGAIGLLLCHGMVTRAAGPSEPSPREPGVAAQPIASAPPVEQVPTSAAVPIGSLPVVETGTHQTRNPAPSAKPSASASAAPAVVESVPSPADALADEVRALDEVRQSLRSGAATKALSQLDQYAKDHPRPVLGNEAQVLRIEALVGAGRKAAAKAMATEYLRQWPNSPFAPKVRALTD